MTAIPLAVPLAWTTEERFHLQSVRFAADTGCDCRRFVRFIR
jgi:hypothetical protein